MKRQEIPSLSIIYFYNSDVTSMVLMTPEPEIVGGGFNQSRSQQ